MTKAQRHKYVQNSEDLIAIFNSSIGKKYKLDCGHHLSIRPGCHLTNNFLVMQDTRKVICSLCAQS